MWIVLAALAAGAGAAAILAFLPRMGPEGPSRLVVIERQAIGGPPRLPAEPATAVPERAAPASAPSPPSQASALASARPAAAPVRDERAATLARSLRRQENKIQACFQQHSSTGQGEPNISVRFQIDTAGAVQGAVVSPGAVATTTLGQCILAVARATEFGPQPEPVSFSIPIAARIVRR